MKVAFALGPLQARWHALGARDQTVLGSAAILVGSALLWWFLIAPPLRTLRLADAQQRSLHTQQQKMLGLKAQAQALKSQPKINRNDALRALEASVKERLSANAQMNTIGDRITVTLRNVPAESLSQWLTQARVTARAIPADVNLTRHSAVAGGPAAWDGTLVLSLPAQ